MFNLRDYQINLISGIYQNWNQGAKNLIGVAPTGAGKTVMMSYIINDSQAPTMAIAHRQELVSQISVALAKNGVYHNIIAPSRTIKFIVSQHIRKTGRNYVNTGAYVSVAGVDTLIRRERDFKNIKYWHCDEGHHLLPSNKWGRAIEKLPNARGLGWSATPIRADRKSLHADHGGIYNMLVPGPCMRELIDRGYLSDYKIIGPKPSIDRSQLKVGSTGDFNAAVMREVARRSSIIGDSVSHYLKFAHGSRAVAFAVDVQSSIALSEKFRSHGVKAENVDAKTPDHIRAEMVERLENNDIDILCNVDLFGEGFDLPAIECVIMARPTESYGLFAQQFGRALRPSPGKDRAIIIDHVGNCDRHGLPDAAIPWTLQIPDIRKIKKREIPLRFCVNEECLLSWEGFSLTCPHCGHRPEPEERGAPDMIEGDLTEYDPDYLDELRKRAAAMIGEPKIPQYIPEKAKYALKAKWKNRKEAQEHLRDAIAWYAGVHRGTDYSELYRRFWYTFGIDVLSAQALSTKEAEILTGKIWEKIEHEHAG